MAYRPSMLYRYRQEEVDRLPSAVFFEEEYVQDADDKVAYNAYWHPELPDFQDDPQVAQRYRCLPLLRVSMNVDVHQTISRTTLKQTFHNGSTKPIAEATYSFPLYDGSAVTGFKCEIGDERLLQGQVKTKPQAEEIYQNAIAEQKAAALLQEHTPEVFEVRLGNIPAQTSVDVEIIYLHELQVEIGGEGLSLTIPTSVAPRYGTPPAGYTPPDGQHGLNIVIDIHLTAPVRKVESTTHPISVESGLEAPPITTALFAGLAAELDPAERQLRHARAKLTDNNAVLNQDFVILIFASDKSLLRSHAILEPAASSTGRAALMVSISPQDFLRPQFAGQKFDGEILLLADRSASMSSKMDSLRKATNLFLKSLPHTCHFNLCSFGSNFSAMWPNSKPWTEDNLDHAIQHVQADFHANMGGTEILAAVKELVKIRSTRCASTQVIVITDGESWAADELISFIAETRRNNDNNIRFFALGLGDKVSHRLVQGIASAGCGFTQVITTNSQSPLNRTVMGMLKGALMPASCTCEISLERPDIDMDADPVQPRSSPEASSNASGRIETAEYQPQPDSLPPLVRAPSRALNLHPFARRSFFYLIDPKDTEIPTSVTVSMKQPLGRTITSGITISQKATGPPMIRELAARAIMLDLQNGQSWLHLDCPANGSRSDTVPVQSEVQKVAEELGTKYGIVGKWTTFVAIDWSNKQSLATRLYRAKKTETKMLMTPRNDQQRISTVTPLSIKPKKGSRISRCMSSVPVAVPVTEYDSARSPRPLGAFGSAKKKRTEEASSTDPKSLGSCMPGSWTPASSPAVILPLPADRETQPNRETPTNDFGLSETELELLLRPQLKRRTQHKASEGWQTGNLPREGDVEIPSRQAGIDTEIEPLKKPDNHQALPKVTSSTYASYSMSDASVTVLRNATERQSPSEPQIRFTSTSFEMQGYPSSAAHSNSPSIRVKEAAEVEQDKPVVVNRVPLDIAYSLLDDTSPATQSWDQSDSAASYQSRDYPQPAFDPRLLSSPQNSEQNATSLALDPVPKTVPVQNLSVRSSPKRTSSPRAFVGYQYMPYTIPVVAPRAQSVTGSPYPHSSPQHVEQSTTPIALGTVTLDDLVQVQASRGNFVLSDDLRQKVFKQSKFKDQDRLEEAIYTATTNTEHATEVQSNLVIDTVLAVLFLTKKCPDQEDEWEFIVQNAMNWLREHGIGEEQMKTFAGLVGS